MLDCAKGRSGERVDLFVSAPRPNVNLERREKKKYSPNSNLRNGQSGGKEKGKEREAKEKACPFIEAALLLLQSPLRVYMTRNFNFFSPFFS